MGSCISILRFNIMVWKGFHSTFLGQVFTFVPRRKRRWQQEQELVFWFKSQLHFDSYEFHVRREESERSKWWDEDKRKEESWHGMPQVTSRYWFCTQIEKILDVSKYVSGAALSYWSLLYLTLFILSSSLLLSPSLPSLLIQSPLHSCPSIH